MLRQGKIWIGDRNGSIYEFDGNQINKIAESPPTNGGEIRAIVDCPIGDLFLCAENEGFYRVQLEKGAQQRGQSGLLEKDFGAIPAFPSFPVNPPITSDLPGVALLGTSVPELN